MKILKSSRTHQKKAPEEEKKRQQTATLGSQTDGEVQAPDGSPVPLALHVSAAASVVDCSACAWGFRLELRFGETNDPPREVAQNKKLATAAEASKSLSCRTAP